MFVLRVPFCAPSLKIFFCANVNLLHFVCVQIKRRNITNIMPIIFSLFDAYCKGVSGYLKLELDIGFSVIHGNVDLEVQTLYCPGSYWE